MQKLQAAFIQFSRLPIPAKPLDKSVFDQSVGYLPAVGLAIGVLAALVFWVTNGLFPAPVAAILAVGSATLATGAIHEDGFADACDGLFGGFTVEKRLEIMKDSRIGSFGAIGLIFLILLKTALLSELAETAVIALIASHTFARIVPLWIMQTSQYANSQSKMTQAIEKDTVHASRATWIALVLAVIFLDFRLVALITLSLLIITYLAKGLFENKLNGYNGDCLGAVEQTSEVIILMAFLYYV